VLNKKYERAQAVASGRPREFDLDKALDRALEVFWRNGYEGSSIADLTEAMGINPPSLYAAFGNKEALFRKALDRYVAERTRFWNEALAKPTAREAIEHLLRESVTFLTEACNPPGCLMIRGALACSEEGEAVRRELIDRRAMGEGWLRERLERAKREGEALPVLEPADFARFIMTVLEGMSVRATSGATRAELHKVADLTMQTWPAQ
jgi:AcrR family transcriptional regulator